MTANITVPTKVSELTNDSGFLTSHQSLSNYSTLSNTIKSLSISGKTITYTKGDDTTGTLTTQDTVYTHPTSSGNKHIPSGGSSGQFLGWSADGTAKWVNNPNTNTWTAMVGATSASNGSVGYVNAVPPKDGYNTKYLRADGTWQVPPDHTYNVYNKTLTIQKNGTNVATFTSNSNTDVTANISVPTKTSDLTNDSGFLTSHQDLSGYIPLSGTNALSGSIVPSTDNAYNFGNSTYGFANFYTNKIYLKGNTIFNLADDNYICVGGATAQANGANLVLNGKNRSTSTGEFKLEARDGTYTRQLIGKPDGTLSWNGDIIPSTDGGYYLGSSSYRFEGGYFGVLYSGLLANFSNSNALNIWGGNNWNTGAAAVFYGKDDSVNPNTFVIRSFNSDNSDWFDLRGYPNGTLTWSGGAFIFSGSTAYIRRHLDTDSCIINGGRDWNSGATIGLSGKDKTGGYGGGCIWMHPSNGSQEKEMKLLNNGTWTWDGQAVQITSDQRLKQQITEIDDKLLDAWEDVEPVQFKYNDAVDQKGDNARLHTGYVVQQIDEACQKHNIDISEYGLYCHEEYPEETEEVEVTQDDGTTTKETKVIREASEHYSLRYTETLVVECAYLRRENDKLKQQIQQYTESLSKFEERLKALEQTSK